MNSSVPVTVIPNSSDIELFRASEESRRSHRESLGWDHRTVLVYAGSLGAIYDVTWIADLAAAMPNDDLLFVVAGHGAQEEQLRQSIQSRGLNERVTFLGPKSKVDVAKLLIASDGTISTLIPHPALEGSSLNKVFDALAAGRVTFSNHAGWLMELVEEQRAGWQLSRHPETAAMQLHGIIKRDGWQVDGEQAARNIADSQFGRDRHYNTLSAIIDELA